ncbi:MAG: hypothetical protein OEV72_12375, partial [Thermoleophilia bacterium]|nr:hypothetical protein [Thermoleophilia bacterium]
MSVAGPLLAPGLVLAVDLNIVPHPHLATMYWGLAQGTHEGALNRLPLDALFVGLGRVGMVGVGEKALLLAIVFLSGYGMHRAAPSRGEVGRYFAGVLYAVNPFVFERLYTGQWFLLLGYALLPFAFTAFAGALAGRRRDFWRFVALAVAVGVASPHMFALLAVLCCAALLAASARARRRRAILRTALAAAAAVVLPSLYWLLPTPGLTDLWRHIGTAQLSLYASVADPGRGLVGTVAGLGGYWNNAQPAHAFQPMWPLLAAGLVALAAWGLACLRRDRFAWAIAATGVAGLVLALGSQGPLGGAFRALLEHVPQARSFREPQKGVGLLVFAYAWLGAAAVDDLHAWVRRYGRVVAVGLAAVLLVLPLGLGYRQLGGLWGSMTTSRFPDSWARARTLLERDAAQSNTLVLPWHGYFALSFAGGRVVANPAPSYFGTPVLASRSVGGDDGTSDNSDPLDAAVSTLLRNGASTRTLGACLAPLGVSHVLLAREADHASYGFLARQRDLVVERRWADLVLYRNTVPASLLMQADALVPAGACPPAGTLRPLAFTSTDPVHLTLGSSPRPHGWIVLARSFRPGWSLSGTDARSFAGGVSAFPAAAASEGASIRLEPAS